MVTRQGSARPAGENATKAPKMAPCTNNRPESRLRSHRVNCLANCASVTTIPIPWTLVRKGPGPTAGRTGRTVRPYWVSLPSRCRQRIDIGGSRRQAGRGSSTGDPPGRLWCVWPRGLVSCQQRTAARPLAVLRPRAATKLITQRAEYIDATWPNFRRSSCRRQTGVTSLAGCETGRSACPPFLFLPTNHSTRP